MKKYCIIGSGRQGTAAAYDIIKFGDPESLLLIDNNENGLNRCRDRLKKLTGYNPESLVIDINNKLEIISALKDVDIFLSAVPYTLNLYLTEIAIASKTSMVDLGGHTDNVIKQLSMSTKASDAGIIIVPDCGMGPGMNVSMALLAMDGMDKVDSVRVWDGGLPEDPAPPWNYNLFFNIQGLTNEYDGNAYFIREGKVVEVPCFEDIEELDFGEKIGILEAAVTSGGLSTMPWTYEGKIKTLENKTLRYNGHWKEMIAYRQLGLFDEKLISYNGNDISPRDFYHYLLKPQIEVKDPHDICIMRTTARGKRAGKTISRTVECIEHYDDETQFLAMEQWTGFHASMVMQHIINGKLDKGAWPIEKALSGVDFYNYSKLRGYDISIAEN